MANISESFLNQIGIRNNYLDSILLDNAFDKVGGEKSLLRAVLWRAIRDLIPRSQSNNEHNPRHLADAQIWFCSHKRANPSPYYCYQRGYRIEVQDRYYFEDVCEILELDPDQIRKTLDSFGLLSSTPLPLSKVKALKTPLAGLFSSRPLLGGGKRRKPRKRALATL